MRKRLIVTLILALVMVFSATVVLAQGGTDGDTETPIVPPCWSGNFSGMGGHFGMMGRGFGMGFGGYGPDVLAEALGLEADALYAELQAGKTIAEIAEAQGVELDAIVEAMSAAHAEQLAAAVEAGYLTQEQADAMQALHEANMSSGLAEGMPFFGAQSDGFFGRHHFNQGRGMFPGGMRGGMRGGRWG